MSNQPEMAPETEVRALSTLWKVQVNAGNDERAQATLDRVHRLQWEIGRAERT
jgi:hypothetical protein